MILHFIGMTKSFLEISEANSGTVRNLELDLLRLIYSINYYKANRVDSEKVFGFILVHNKEIADRIIFWTKKYNFSDENCFKILLFDNLPSDIIESIRAEKNHNKTFVNSKSDFGKEITERELCKHIDEFINKLSVNYKRFEILEKTEFEININWDYYKAIDVNEK